MRNYIEIEDIDAFENMTEEDEETFWDEHNRPQKANKVKSLLPLYVYFILEKNSSSGKPLMQKEIQEILEKQYQLTIERKALSRTINTLCDAGLGICKDETGVWMR